MIGIVTIIAIAIVVTVVVITDKDVLYKDSNINNYWPEKPVVYLDSSIHSKKVMSGDYYPEIPYSDILEEGKVDYYDLRIYFPSSISPEEILLQINGVWLGLSAMYIKHESTLGWTADVFLSSEDVKGVILINGQEYAFLWNDNGKSKYMLAVIVEEGMEPNEYFIEVRPGKFPDI